MTTTPIADQAAVLGAQMNAIAGSTSTAPTASAGSWMRTSKRPSTRSTTRPSWTRGRARVEDKRVLRLVKAFLKAVVLTEDHNHEDALTGTPQGGNLSPLLANIALSALDEHLTRP
ncbi:hypothetical protein AB0942_02360 [Streptomyces nodosus]|uniref:hypothetical protein n=1 Tax=Streptomyces nodosus TaxID=40318 RepID=UPI0034541C62